MPPADINHISIAIHSIDFQQLISSRGKPGFALSVLIILDWSKVNLLLETAVHKYNNIIIRIMINKVYLAIPKPWAESGVVVALNQHQRRCSTKVKE